MGQVQNDMLCKDTGAETLEWGWAEWMNHRKVGTQVGLQVIWISAHNTELFRHKEIIA